MKPKFLTLCALWAIAALGGCHRDSSQSPKPAAAPKARAPVAQQHGPTVEAQTAGMVEAASQGKGQAPVALKFDLMQRPIVGQSLEIAIALIPQIAAGPTTIDVTASDGLQVAADDGQIAFPAVEALQVYRHSIKLTPTDEGVRLVTLTVSLKHDEMTDSRVFSVPIIVAAAKAAATTSEGATKH
jgi:hypothetical protein